VLDGALCACELDRNLLPIAPVRFLVGKLIDSMKDRNQLAQMLGVTEKALQEISNM
jgi:hypothetical protein